MKYISMYSKLTIVSVILSFTLSAASLCRFWLVAQLHTRVCVITPHRNRLKNKLAFSIN